MRISGWRGFLSVLMLLFGVLAGMPASAQSMAAAAPAPTAMTAAQCTALRTTDFSNVPDAPSEVLVAEVVAANDLVPSYCRVEGYVSPQVGFAFHLPLANWNGKFVMTGCGGMCGDLSAINSCAEAIARDYACGTTDMGHHAVSTSGKWAYNNPQAEIDIGHRATHVTTVMGKALVKSFYASDPIRSYFLGCSTGGRQGLVEAQRYPYDYDGIVAGSPVTYTYTAPLQLYWVVSANLDADGHEIMGFEKLKFLAASVMAACDGVDGLKDGVITDPRMCKFDVGTLACKAGADSAGCLDQKEMAVVRKYYAGPSTSKGPIGTDGSAPLGSEMTWAPYFMGAGRNSIMYKWATDNLRYMGFAIDPGPSYQMTDFNWDRDPQRLSYSLLAGGNPDIRLFTANGGKLLMYHGGIEAALARTLEYYNMVSAILGGRAKSEKSVQMYVMPGFGHCAGANGVNYFDQLSVMERWVEKGEAPDMIMGYNVPFKRKWDDRDKRFADGGKAIGPMLAPAGFTGANVAEINPAFTRPLYPFPDLTIYKSGDPNNPASYKRVPGSDRSH